jgi:hypothetical protein
MIEDEPVELIVQQELRARSSQATRHNNPFILPSDVESFGYSDLKRRENQSKREGIRNMNLIQRTDAIKPRAMPFTLHVSRPDSAMEPASSGEMSMAAKLRSQKRHRIAEFIRQKREIFLVQMLIDRKNEEIAKIYNSMKNAEANLVATEANIEELKVQYKADNAKSEASLTKARKASEAATTQRVTLLRAFKRATLSISLMKSEIMKRKEMLEGFHTFNQFLLGLVPDGYTIETYFTSAQVAIDAMDQMEREGYEMIDVCQTFNGRLARATGVLDADIKDANKTIEVIDEQYDTYMREKAVDENEFVFRGKKNSEQLDADLEAVSALVTHTYIKCFEKASNITPLAMLEKIENTLEKFYRSVLQVEPSFVAEKTAVRMKERREEQRIFKQVKQEQDQARKREQAAMRANKPIKQRFGRPLVRRSIIAMKGKTNDEYLRRVKREQDRIENLLYGPAFSN